jgi:hypothetical protein
LPAEEFTMQIEARCIKTFQPVRLASALRAAVLAAACVLTQAPASATGTEGGSAVASSPTATSQGAKMPPAPTAKVNSKSPYAAWRAQHEQAEAPDTSGHGHRAPLPEGQSHPRRVPQK